jgi:hypothetical protein
MLQMAAAEMLDVQEFIDAHLQSVQLPHVSSIPIITITTTFTSAIATIM